MKLPNGLTPQEIRVLQEFRRAEKDQMTDEEIGGITHPGGAPAGLGASLVAKGFLAAATDGPGYRLTDRSRAFLAAKPAPAGSEAESGGETA